MNPCIVSRWWPGRVCWSQWLTTATGQLRVLMWALMGVLMGCAVSLSAQAQGLESALSPGLLIQGHAKWQDQCASCHVRFDRQGQDRLCLDCHKPLAQDVREGTGFHGLQAAQAKAQGRAMTCRQCHTDHKGREASIVQLDRARFDHRQTDWPLREAHAKPACAACHPPGQAWRHAPQECAACHRKDDVHKAALGQQCADCHQQSRWKPARFDHDSTRFALTGRHTEVACADCHPKARYRDVPQTCIGCHKAEDKHRGRYGDRCETCHGARDWKRIDFNHETDARYALRGKHRAVKCDSCHTGSLYRDKLTTDCQACHRKDDSHQGALGSDCASCHQEGGWKQVARFDHDRSRFPLLGRHAQAECASCHRPDPRQAVVYRQTPMDCQSCHRADDRHEGTLGASCQTCHSERNWKIARFDHDSTAFKLRGAHAAPSLACSSCHRNAKQYRNTPQACVDCHRSSDRHENQLGAKCDNCHGEQSWKVPRFDHNRARFALLGAHAPVRCEACHNSLRYRDTASDCLACHQRQDRHQARLGEDCASCHNARHWRLIRFDHGRDTRYGLTGAHAAVACADCHIKPAPAGAKVAPVSTACVDCHRLKDPHDGAFGARCETCHQTSQWTALVFRRSGGGGGTAINSGASAATTGATRLPGQTPPLTDPSRKE